MYREYERVVQKAIDCIKANLNADYTECISKIVFTFWYVNHSYRFISFFHSASTK